jgi:RNA polymerase primary sigma factor
MEEYLGQDISIPEGVEKTEPMKIYLREISSIPVLDAEEELALAKRIKEGDIAAKRKIEEASLRMVVSIAGKYSGRGLQFMDLIQEGNMGLMSCVESFDYTKGERFSVYASRWIEEAMSLAIEEQVRDIQVPAQAAKNMQKTQNAMNVLRQELGREAGISEIVQWLGDSTEKEVEHSLSLLKKLDFSTEYSELEDVTEEKEPETEEGNPQDDAIASLIRKEEVLHLLESLNETERKIISTRFGLDNKKVHTIQETAEVLNMTGDQISLIEEEAMKKLRAAGDHSRN